MKTFTEEEVKNIVCRISALISENITNATWSEPGFTISMKREHCAKCCHVDTSHAEVFLSWEEILNNDLGLSALAWQRFDEELEKQREQERQEQLKRKQEAERQKEIRDEKEYKRLRVKFEQQ